MPGTPAPRNDDAAPATAHRAAHLAARVAAVSPEDLERLAAEAIPDGRFGGPRPPAPERRPPPDPFAAEHRIALEDALKEHKVGRPGRRHLRAVPDPDSTSHREAS